MITLVSAHSSERPFDARKVKGATGSRSRVGRATARLFAAEGAKVAVLSLTPANIEAVVADIEAAGETALGISTDVSDADQIKAAIEQVAATWGGVDILVNNAFDPSVVQSPVIELSVEQLQRNFDTGPIAFLRMMQAAYPYLKASGEGRVINFASLAGVTGLRPYAPYNMAKEAVRALTRVAAREGRTRSPSTMFSPWPTPGARKRKTFPHPIRRLVASVRRRRTSRLSCCSSPAKMRSSSPATVSPPMAAPSSTLRADGAVRRALLRAAAAAIIRHRRAP